LVADLKVNPPQTGIAGKLSKVWVVPVVALLVSLFLAVQQYRNRDVTIRIDFPDASGIEEGKTELKFQKIKVGLVREIRFSDDLRNIHVLVDVDREIASYIDSDAKFWRVKPEISISGIRGLDTLLKGDYIHGEWDATRGTPEDTFVAEEDPPLITAGEEGSEIHLVTLQNKPIVVGSPVYLRGIKVGIIKAVDLSADGNSVVVALFVSAPYDQFINTGTRFWNASGIDVSLDTSGLDVQIASVATLLQGGIAFSTSLSGGEPITDSTVFDLHPTRKSAEESLLTDNLRAQVRLSSIFGGSLKGLKIGADVEYHGLKVGKVVSISAIQKRTGSDGPALELVVSYTVQPARLGLANIDNPEQTLAFLEDAVTSNGLRARLITKSILGGLTVELFEDPEADSATLIRQDSGFPVLPSVPTAPETLKVAAESVLKRVANLPIEALIAQTSHLIANIDALVTDDDTQKIPADIVTILESVDMFIQSDDFQAIPTGVETALSRVNSQLNTFETGNGMANLIAALENVRAISESVETTSAKLPKIADDAAALIDQVRELPVDTVIASANDLLASLTTLAESPETQRVPEALTRALEQVRLALLELREGGTTENINKTLESAQSAMTSLAEAASDLPELVAKLTRLSDTAKIAIKGVSPTSLVYRKITGAIDNIDRTVRSLNSLIRQIERKPNSLLVGR
jgi:paraquat-inducible protein B